jgi:hypothetical protein
MMNFLFFRILFVVSLCSLGLGFKVNRQSSRIGMNALKLSNEDVPKTISKFLSASVIAASLIGPPAAAIFVPTQAAHADVRAQQKRTYFRFVPRLITGRDFYKNELKQAVDKEDWDVVTKFFDTFVVKVNPNDPNQIDQTDTFVNQNFFRPMASLHTSSYYYNYS